MYATMKDEDIKRTNACFSCCAQKLCFDFAILWTEETATKCAEGAAASKQQLPMLHTG